MSTCGQNLGPALLFGVTAGLLGTILTTIYAIFAPLPTEQLLREMVPGLAPMMSSNSPFDAVGSTVSIVFSPAYALVSIMITALVVHIFLRLVGSGKNGLNATIKIVSYSMAGAVLVVLPWIGLLLAPLAQGTLMVIGAARMHRTGYVRATIAIVLPLLLLAIFVAVAVYSLQTLIPSSLPLPTGKFI